MKKHCCWISYKWVNKIESGSHIKDIARKTIFPFSKCSEKMDFPKKSNWNMIFLVSTGKMAFLFPKNMILFFRDGKWNDLSQKKYMEIWFFLQMFWKCGFFKKNPLEWDLFCITKKDGISFSRKFDIFSIHGKWKMIFLKNAWKYDAFSIFGKDSLSFMKFPFCLKKAKMILSRKIHLKMTFPASLEKMILILEKMILEI